MREGNLIGPENNKLLKMTVLRRHLLFETKKGERPPTEKVSSYQNVMPECTIFVF